MSAPQIALDDSPRARRTDPTTSHAAADSISAHALEDREREVLAILRGASRPVSAQQVEDEHERRVWHSGGTVQRYSPSGIRTALSQLTEAGVLEPAGETRTASGRRATTLRLVVDDDARIAALAAVEREHRLTRLRARRDHTTTKETR